MILFLPLKNGCQLQGTLRASEPWPRWCVRMSATAKDSRQYLVAQNRLIAIHAAQVFVRWEVSKMTTRAERMQKKLQLEREKEAAEQLIAAGKDAGAQLAEAEKTFHRLNSALPTLEAKCPEIKSVLDDNLMPEWSSEAAGARRELDRIRGTQERAMNQSVEVTVATLTEKLNTLGELDSRSVQVPHAPQADKLTSAAASAMHICGPPKVLSQLACGSCCLRPLTP